MIHLLCTFEPARLPRIPQFVDHYRALGVDQFHLSLHLEPDVERAAMAAGCEQADRVLSPLGIDLSAVLICPFSAYNLRDHHRMLQAQRCGESDWIVWADIDEFQIYPDNLRALIEGAEKNGIDFFAGKFIDRIAESGRLEAFDPSRSIWLQYPRRSEITRLVAGAAYRKVTCARAGVKVTVGNHNPEDETLRPWGYLVQIHHFKWDAMVTERLNRRLLPDFKQHWWWVESQRLIDYLEETEGRLLHPSAARHNEGEDRPSVSP